MAFLFLDIIFPKRCVGCGKTGYYICDSCFDTLDFGDAVCPVCRRSAIEGRTHSVCATKYSLDGLMFGCRYGLVAKRAIKALKYRWVSDMAGSLCDVLFKNFWKFGARGNLVLVPIPLHRRREKWRGFNQAKLFCNVIARKYKVETLDLLVRNRETRTQVGLSRVQRKANVNGVFTTTGMIDPKFTYVLVDDVFTTGATMFEACKVMKKAGAFRVWGMVIALD